jgi:hypothetical protein
MQSLIMMAAASLGGTHERRQSCWEFCDCHAADRAEENRLFATSRRRGAKRNTSEN